MISRAIKFCLHRVVLLAVLLAGSLSCGNEVLGPLVRLRVTGLPASADKVVLTVTINGVTKTQEFTGSDSFDVITISFPQGTTGDVTVSLRIYAGICLVGSGSGMLTLNGDEVRELPIPSLAPSLSCGAPAAKIIVQVTNTTGAMGTVSSNPPGIECGTDCEELYPVGTVVTLRAVPKSGSFLGWADACSDVNDCTLTLTTEKDYIVKASFAVRPCVGWCPDPAVPAGLTSTLYGIAGSGPNSVVAVGAGGKILYWNGTSWTEQTSGTTQTLRAVTTILGMTPTAFVAVGDAGVALSSMDGKTWTRMPGPATSLRGVAGGKLSFPSTTTVYAVGDNGLAIKGDLNSLVTPDTIPVALIGKTLNAVTVQSSVGFFFGVPRAIVGVMGTNARDQEISMTPTASDLYGVYYGSNRIFAVGGTGTSAVIFSRILVSNGMTSVWQAWTAEALPSGVNILRAIWGSASYSIFAVGDLGTIVNFDGTAWARFSNPSTKNLNGIWGTGPNNIYAVGEAGTILHYVP